MLDSCSRLVYTKSGNYGNAYYVKENLIKVKNKMLRKEKGDGRESKNCMDENG